MVVINQYGYVCRAYKDHINKRVFRNPTLFLVKARPNKSNGYAGMVELGIVRLPAQLVGERVRFKLEFCGLVKGRSR